MKGLSRCLGTLALLAASASLSLGCRKAHADDSDSLVVHEWGTFTSMQGADGVSMEGMQHESEPLPPFVHSRLEATQSPFAIYGDHSRDVPVHVCRGKMETPVIYFHTGRPRNVRVHVDFKGLLTQWYPAASAASPAFPETAGPTPPRALGQMSASSLDWDLDLLPMRGGRPPGVPEVKDDSDWQRARAVQAAYVRSRGTNEAEDYVFYRGLTGVAPRAHVEGASLGNATVKNDAAAPIDAGFVLEMRADTARFRPVARLAPGESRQIAFSADAWRSKKEVVAALEESMHAALMTAGLFDDEARAMVRTWSPTWFASEGTRLLYLLPRTVTDDVLPMKITPAPDALVRVMVGRVEILTVERAAEITAALRDTTSPDDAARQNAWTALAKLGRFLEPAVRAILQKSTDPALRAGCSAVLARFAI